MKKFLQQLINFYIKYCESIYEYKKANKNRYYY